MEYLEFERILSAKRMQRYKDATCGDTRKAMALYRYNLRLSQEMPKNRPTFGHYMPTPRATDARRLVCRCPRLGP